MLAANQTIIDPHHSVAQVAHIINDLIGQLELVHCAYQLVQLEGVDAVVEHVEHGVNWVMAWACDGAPSEDIGGMAWACDGAPSEDIGGTAWARFLLGGARSVLH